MQQFNAINKKECISQVLFHIYLLHTQALFTVVDRIKPAVGPEVLTSNIVQVPDQSELSMPKSFNESDIKILNTQETEFSNDNLTAI